MTTARREAPSDLVVFSVLKASVCSSCKAAIEKGDLLRMEKEQPLCLSCADLDHLVYLPAGDAALSRRSRKHSTLSAVVVRFSRARKRYERQGLLVEPAALEQAEQECLDDEEQRQRARSRAALAREQADGEYIKAFAQAILAVYPGCPMPEAQAIASHACLKHSGRVGRSAAARTFSPEAITLAVAAHVRHRHSKYDSLLGRGWDRTDARHVVAEAVNGVLERWRTRRVRCASHPTKG